MIKTQTWSGDQNILPPERRRFLRIEAAVQIEIRPFGTDVPMRLETSDISQGGCYVETSLTLELGTKLDIVLWLDQQKVTTKGTVVTRHSQFGNGVEFDRLSPENVGKLRFFLDSREGSWHTRTWPV